METLEMGCRRQKLDHRTVTLLSGALVKGVSR